MKFDDLLSNVQAGKGHLYRVVLSEQGKEVYKGGNISVMKQMLIHFYALDMRHAEGIFHKRLIARLGSANAYLYKIERVK
jgi:hypothetical protein